MLDDILMDRVFKAFDKDNDSYINAQEWVNGVCLFLNRFLFSSFETELSLT